MAHPALTDPTTTALIERKIRSLVGTWGITPTDAEDIRQELYLDLLERLPRHDPAKAPITLFVAACVHRKIYNVLRARRTRFHGPERPCVTGEDEASSGAAQMADAAERTARRQHGLEDLRLDLGAALAALPEHLRLVAAQLMSSSPRKAAAELGLPHDRVYRYVAEIRAVFAQHGLDQYLA